MEPIELTWQWPAGRTPEKFAIVQVTKIAKASNPLSPSTAGWLPDPVVMTGTGASDAQHIYHVRMPQSELEGTREGEKVGLGLVGDLCICIIHPVTSSMNPADHNTMKEACAQHPHPGG